MSCQVLYGLVLLMGANWQVLVFPLADALGSQSSHDEMDSIDLIVVLNGYATCSPPFKSKNEETNFRKRDDDAASAPIVSF